MRGCNNFDNPLALKSLYCALASGPIYSLEAIQNRFLRLISIKYNIKRLPYALTLHMNHCYYI
ncbi:Uncharacterized protein FWK35_00007026 [Aphis craccivora]|uniref:Uncharacterized protein n=1 Tax=Aphis craccivora TaxID=307492 RepID=A0A6G0YRE4_APHCR|nr:Uncharacterized protein FWK35_00007026 [Aphis craccivora]